MTLTEQIFSWLIVLALAIGLDVVLFRWRRAAAPQWAARWSARIAGWLAPLRERARPAAPEAAPGIIHAEMSNMPTDNEPQELPEPSASEATVSASPQIITNTTTDHNLTRITLEVPAGASVRVMVETWASNTEAGATPRISVQSVEAPQLGRVNSPIASARSRLAWLTAMSALWVRKPITLAGRVIPTEVITFGLALIVYFITHIVGLERFPIYFFTDEAVHMNFASTFIRNGFTNYEREFLPTYFSLGPSFGLNSVSVYVQIVPYLLFGKSVFVTRTVSMLITLLGAAWVSLSLKHAFKLKPYWLGVLLLSVSPAWFLHSRTAFEYIEVASFYAGFIYFYLRYRTDQPPALYAAMVLGALTFYTHGLGQVLMGLTGVTLLVADLPYHLHPARRAVVLRALGLGLALALPYARYAITHPATIQDQLRQRDSYWTNLDLTLADKLLNFAREYLYGLNPQFWYIPNDRDLSRHVMKGYGHLLWPTLPFVLIGLGLCLKQVRSAPYRVVLITLLVSPVPSALVAIGVPRMLWLMVPAALLTALGLAQALEWLAKWRPSFVKWATGGIWVGLVGFNVWMLGDVLINASTWYTDYGLYGMQYGAQQIYGDFITPRLKQDPNVKFYVSPSWSNGTDQFLPFFFDDPQHLARVQTRAVDEFLFQRLPLDPAVLFVMMSAEYERAVTSAKFKTVAVESTLLYPDGTIGFYVARLEYADNVDEVFAAEAAERRKPVEGQIMIDGQMVTARYSRLGGGDLIHIFDGDTFTLARGLEANPFVIELTFPEPRSVSGLAADFGSMDFALAVLLYPVGSDVPQPYAQTFTQNKPDPHVEMPFTDAPAQVSRLRLEVRHLAAGATAQIHIRELKFLP